MGVPEAITSTTFMPTTSDVLDALQRLPLELLYAVLAPHTALLTLAGFDVPTVSSDELLVRRAELPAPFLDRMFDLYELSDPEGERLLSLVADRHRYRLAAHAKPITRAAIVLLERPQLYTEAVTLRTIEPVRPLYELIGRELRPPRFDDLGLKQAETELTTFFERESSTRYCVVDPFHQDDALGFRIRYAKPRSFSRRFNGEQELTNEGWPVGSDVVLYDAGSLRIGCRALETREEYGRVFGRLLFGSETWFRRLLLIRFEPLHTPSLAFAPTDEIEAVKVVDVYPMSGPRVPVGPDNTHPLFGVEFRPDTIRRLHLNLLHQSDRSWHPVTLHPPNGLTGHRWSDDRVARQFLRERKFLLGYQDVFETAETDELARSP